MLLIETFTMSYLQSIWLSQLCLQEVPVWFSFWFFNDLWFIFYLFLRCFQYCLFAGLSFAFLLISFQCYFMLINQVWIDEESSMLVYSQDFYTDSSSRHKVNGKPWEAAVNLYWVLPLVDMYWHGSNTYSGSNFFPSDRRPLIIQASLFSLHKKHSIDLGCFVLLLV